MSNHKVQNINRHLMPKNYNQLNEQKIKKTIFSKLSPKQIKKENQNNE